MRGCVHYSNICFPKGKERGGLCKSTTPNVAEIADFAAQTLSDFITMGKEMKSHDLTCGILKNQPRSVDVFHLGIKALLLALHLFPL